jgi:A nuclease family of the HNH/ENDO VII superfamily with conserved AHH
MNSPLPHAYRLAARGEAGLACDENGAALGGVDLVRVRRDVESVTHCQVRSPVEIGQILRAAYGPQSQAVALRLHRGLRRTAVWLEAGDLARAGMEAVMLGLPDVAPEALAKLADFEKAANTAWQTEARIPAGQPGGGQWTTGSGASSAVRPPSNVPKEPQSAGASSPTPLRGTDAEATASSDAGAVDTPHGGLLIPVSTAVAVAGGYGMAEDFALPEGVARLGRAGLLAFAATLLDQADHAAAQAQVTNAIARFGLDPGRPADVMAASAYVWSRYALPAVTAAPFSGPALDAASEAVLRCVLANPGALPAMLEGSTAQEAKAASLIIGAADAGLIDYAAESRARPPGVAPELQTRSSRARAAIAEQLRLEKMQAHHLVAAENWRDNLPIAIEAVKAGWRPDDPSNLIGLPIDPATQAELEVMYGERLPLHNGYHKIYNNELQVLIAEERKRFSQDLTPTEARAIFDDVARKSRQRIILGQYGTYPKMFQ